MFLISGAMTQKLHGQQSTVRVRGMLMFSQSAEQKATSTQTSRKYAGD